MSYSSSRYRPAPRHKRHITLAVRIIYAGSKSSHFMRRDSHTNPGSLVVPTDLQLMVREDLRGLGIAQPKKEHIYFSAVVGRAVELVWPNLEYLRSARPVEIKLTHGLLEAAPRLGGLSISAVMSYVLQPQVTTLHTVLPYDNPCAFIHDPATTNDFVRKVVRVWERCAHSAHPMIPYPQRQPVSSSSTAVSAPKYDTATDLHAQGDLGYTGATSSVYEQRPPSPVLSPISDWLSPTLHYNQSNALDDYAPSNTRLALRLKRKYYESTDDSDADDSAITAGRVSKRASNVHTKTTTQLPPPPPPPPPLPPPQLATSPSTQHEQSASDLWKARARNAELREQKALDILRGALGERDGPKLDLPGAASALKDKLSSLREEVQSLWTQVRDGETRFQTLRDESAQQIQALNWGHQNPQIASSLTNALLQISAMSASLNADQS